MSLQRYKLTIAYRGTRYRGWQIQHINEMWKGPPLPEGTDELPTVQGVLNAAFGRVLGHPAMVVGSSRTDAGVHAKGQVAHLDTSAVHIPPDGLRRAVNARLPPDVVIRTLEAAPPGFHAILGTECKRYQYVVRNTEDRDVFGEDLAFHRWQDLDLPGMGRAAGHLAGTHDFTSFAKPGHGRSTAVRTILESSVTWRAGTVVIGVTGTGFLWHMVRIIAGTLVEVGLGRFAPDDVQVMLAAKDRAAAGSTAPPHGLYLQWIRYHNRGADKSPEVHVEPENSDE